MVLLPESSTIHPVDIHVGQRLRILRRSRKKSQSELADAVGITFQQVQKYERGTNRVSASRLYDIAAYLEAPISYFFDGLDESRTSAPGEVSEFDAQRIVQMFVALPEGVELAQNFLRLADAGTRRQIAALVRELAQGPRPDEP